MNTITLERYDPIHRTFTYDMDNGPDIARYIARERYAWPGGYELFAVTDDGGVLCNDCCRSEYISIRTAYPGDGWNVTGYGSDADTDSLTTCDACNRTIVEEREDPEAIPRDAVHYLDSARGQYIPRDFFLITDPDCINWHCDDSTRDWILDACKDPDHDDYNDAWNDCACYGRLTVTDPDNGVTYELHQDGDLWLIPA